ncbi:unnamed protein product, partial [Polarella glacialis]
MAHEDMSNTPAERATKLAAAQAAAAAGGAKPWTNSYNTADEEALFAQAEEITIGGRDHIVIVGAGLVGALCAVVLLQKGFK